MVKNFTLHTAATLTALSLLAAPVVASASISLAEMKVVAAAPVTLPSVAAKPLASCNHGGKSAVSRC